MAYLELAPEGAQPLEGAQLRHQQLQQQHADGVRVEQRGGRHGEEQRRQSDGNRRRRRSRRRLRHHLRIVRPAASDEKAHRERGKLPLQQGYGEGGVRTSCSGGAYSGSSMPVSGLKLMPTRRSVAAPRSMNLTLPPAVMSTLDGLTSRWMIPL